MEPNLDEMNPNLDEMNPNLDERNPNSAGNLNWTRFTLM